MEENLGHETASWPLKTWDLADLTLAAFYFHPDLEIARVASAEAAVVTAGARPNPSIRIAPGGETSPESPWLFAFSFDLPIEIASKRGYRIQRARSLSEAAKLDLGNAAWTVRSRLRSTFAQYMAAVQTVELLRRQDQVLAERVGLLQAQLEAGEIPRPEPDTAQIEKSNTRIGLHAAEGRMEEWRATLAAAIGVPVSACFRWRSAAVLRAARSKGRWPS